MVKGREGKGLGRESKRLSRERECVCSCVCVVAGKVKWSVECEPFFG